MQVYYAAPDTTWTDVTPYVPFTDYPVVPITFRLVNSDVPIQGYWRPNGSSFGSGEYIGQVDSNAVRSVVNTQVVCGSDGVFEVRFNASTTSTMLVMQTGWYFPRGM